MVSFFRGSHMKKKVLCILITSVFASSVSNVFAGGLIGDFVGTITGNRDIGRALDKTNDEAKKVVEKTGRELGNAVNDTIKTVQTGTVQGDIGKTAVKAVDDTVKEMGRAGENIGTAAV